MAKRVSIHSPNGYPSCLIVDETERSIQMTREEMLSLREEVYTEYKKRVALGEFDANSGAIQLCLHTLVDLINHTLEDMKKDERLKKGNLGPPKTDLQKRMQSGGPKRTEPTAKG